MSVHHLDRLFAPESLALVGRFGGRAHKERIALENLRRSGCGRLTAVDLDGALGPEGPDGPLRIASSVAGLDAEVDVLIASLPLSEAAGLLEQCGRGRVRNLVLAHRRMTAEDEAHERAAVETARRLGTRLLGPNSFGVMVPGSGLNTSFFDARPAAGTMALVSQSGSVISSVLDLAREQGVGFSHVVSLGALGDIDFGDVIDYLGWETGVRALLLCVENLGTVKKFLSACRSVSRVKPIVALKAGRSALGRAVIAKHTGRPSGEDRVYDTALRRGGVIRVESAAELLASGAALSRRALPNGRRLGIVTNSGGVGALVADSLSLRAAPVAELSPDLRSRLEQYVAPYSGNLNPTCIAGDADVDRYADVIALYLDSGEFDTLFVVVVLGGDVAPEDLAERMRARAQQQKVDLLYLWLGNRRDHEAQARRLAEAGDWVYFDAEEAVAAYCYTLRYFDNLANVVVAPPRFDRELQYRRKEARTLVESLLAAGPVGEVDAGELLEHYGIPVSRGRTASTAAEAAGIARQLGYPVQLRPSGKAGGAPTFRVCGEEELLASYDLASAGAGGVSLQRAVGPIAYEFRAGARTDVELGPYLFLGAGGPMWKAGPDEAVVLPPLNRLLARRLIAKSRLAERLSLAPAEAEGLEEILVRLSQLVVDLPEVTEIELGSLALSDAGFLVQESRAALRDRGIASPAHLVTAPYPNQYESVERLRDGTEVLVRPIKPEDAPAHYDFIRSLSSRSIYNRFFGFRKYITDEQMVRFTQIDYDREIAIVARLRRDGEEVTIGVNRLVYEPQTGRHEFAIVVADAWQKSGVGAVLMRRLIDIARDRRVGAIHGMVRSDNGPMLALARKVGFVAEGREGNAVLIRLDLP